jgi:hypothetical protein
MRKQMLAATLVLLGALVFTTTLVGAQTVSNGPYYATPSWDQKLQCDTQATCPRFIVLSNWNSDAVLDRETGLVWERSPGTGPQTWLFAQVHCTQNLTLGNRRGWRLPTIQELASLVDPSVGSPGPALPAGHPFTNVQSSTYWSATTYSNNADVAWFVDFSNGGVNTVDKPSAFFAWCVRGGQGVDPQ